MPRAGSTGGGVQPPPSGVGVAMGVADGVAAGVSVSAGGVGPEIVTSAVASLVSPQLSVTVRVADCLLNLILLMHWWKAKTSWQQKYSGGRTDRI